MKIFANAVKEVLAGNLRALNEAFVWSESKEGHDYWADIYIKSTLPKDARAKLQAMIRPRGFAALASSESVVKSEDSDA